MNENHSSSIVSLDWEVRQELRSLDLTPEIVRTVAFMAASAKAEALSIDPLSTPGTLAYIHGVRGIRMQLLPQGWKIGRDGNVESTVNHDLGVQLCFQNVDRACSSKKPEAISGKGSGSRKLINAGQMEMFSKATIKGNSLVGVTPTVWLVCVSVDGDSVQAEVSCPETFEGDQFDGFVKRIFVVDEKIGPQPDLSREVDDNDSFDFDVQVTKK